MTDFIPEMRDAKYYEKRLGSKKSAAKKKRDEARKAREFARKYGSIERVFYISECLACAVPGCNAGPQDNAHTQTGGTGRKADSTTVIPLCTGMYGHHAEWHKGDKTFCELYGLDPDKAAADTEESWTLYGDEVVARAKADGRFDAWLERTKTC